MILLTLNNKKELLCFNKGIENKAILKKKNKIFGFDQKKYSVESFLFFLKNKEHKVLNMYRINIYLKRN